MIDLSLYNGNARLMSLTPYARDEDTSIRCNEHGYESLSTIVPRRLTESIALAYQEQAPLTLRAVDRAGFVAFDGRLEDPALYADEGGSGLKLTAYGFQNAYRDVPYTALWSTQDTSAWRPILETEQGGWSPQRYTFDMDGRLFISPNKGETHGGAVGARNIAGLAYIIPDRSDRVITRISFDYAAVFPSVDWYLQVTWYSAAPTGSTWTAISSANIINGTGSGSTSQTLTGSPVAVEIRVAPLFNPGVALAQESGTQYARITNLRVTTATPTIHGGTIASALVDVVSSVNAGQVDTSKEYILSPGYDLTDEVYEDMAPADILDKLIALGDNQTPPRLWQWSVWEGRKLRFEPRGTNAKTWYINAAAIELNRTLSQLTNSAYAVYRDSSGGTLRTATASDSASVAAYGLTRRQAVTAETANAAQAAVTRDAVILDGKRLKPQANAYAVSALYHASGGRVPAYYARPGDTIVVRNVPPLRGESAGTGVTSFRIVTTEYQNGVNTVTPESPIPTLDTLLARREERI